MKEKKIFIVIIGIILILNLNCINCYSFNSNKIYSEVLKELNLKNVETYIKITLNSDLNEDLVKNIKTLKTIIEEEEIVLKTNKKNYEYKKNLDIANFNIIQKGSTHKLELYIKLKKYEDNKVYNLLEKIEKSFNRKSNLKIFINIKAKLVEENEINFLRENIEKKIEIKGYDINTITLNNGYSTKVSKGMNTKFYYSLSNYDTGTYIVIGNPEIFISY